MRSSIALRPAKPDPTARLSGGFSLIEVLVVIAIIAVIAGMMALSIGEDPQRSVKDESQRLYALLMQIREEAILQGQLYVLQIDEDRYDFKHPDKEGKLQTIQEDVFRPRQFSGNVSVQESEIEGRDTGKTPALVIYPTGDISVFRIVLGNTGGEWQLTGDGEGIIKAGPVEDES